VDQSGLGCVACKTSRRRCIRWGRQRSRRLRTSMGFSPVDQLPQLFTFSGDGGKLNPCAVQILHEMYHAWRFRCRSSVLFPRVLKGAASIMYINVKNWYQKRYCQLTGREAERFAGSKPARLRDPTGESAADPSLPPTAKHGD
jgi:hypothetical protein